MEQPKEGKTVFKQMEVEAETLVATDKDNNVFYKFGFNKELKGKNLIKSALFAKRVCLLLLGFFAVPAFQML